LIEEKIEKITNRNYDFFLHPVDFLTSYVIFMFGFIESSVHKITHKEQILFQSWASADLLPGEGGIFPGGEGGGARTYV
jgi:hypothetical protein